MVGCDWCITKVMQGGPSESDTAQSALIKIYQVIYIVKNVKFVASIVLLLKRND